MSEAEATATFLDTSVIVRYLTGDPPAMADRAAAVIDTDQPLILSELALVETAYVLESFYKVQCETLVNTLIALVQRHNIQLLSTSKPLVLDALQLCRPSKRVSFTDALLWAQAREHGGAKLVTFDQRFPTDEIEIENP